MSFASSEAYISDDPLKIEVFNDDMAPNDLAYTDGIGMISESLLLKVIKL